MAKKDTSLLEAISEKNVKLIKEIEKKMEKGEVVRII